MQITMPSSREIYYGDEDSLEQYENRSFDRVATASAVVATGAVGYIASVVADALTNEGGVADFSPSVLNVATAVMAAASVMPLRRTEPSLSQRDCGKKAAIIGGALGAAAGLFVDKVTTSPVGVDIDKAVNAGDTPAAVVGAFTGAVVGRALAIGFGCRNR